MSTDRSMEYLESLVREPAAAPDFLDTGLR